MPDQPTREYARMRALEIGGAPVEITSAELCWIQHWNGDTPAQREWEVRGRTMETSVPDGVREIVMTFADRRLRGRGVVDVSVGPGLTVIMVVGLGTLAEVRG